MVSRDRGEPIQPNSHPTDFLCSLRDPRLHIAVHPATNSMPANVKIYRPPQQSADLTTTGLSLYLAGPMQLLTAQRWQDKVLQDLNDLPINVFIPRRDDVNTVDYQRPTNADYRAQVTWELDHLARADLVAIYFESGLDSPELFSELGRCVQSPHKVIVCCPAGYQGKLQVQSICNNYGIPIINDFQEFVRRLVEVLREKVRGAA